MKMNKIIAGIMAVCIMCLGVPYVNKVAENNSVITASAEDETDYTEGTYDNLAYKNYGNYIEISGCDVSATDVVIPPEIEGLPVTSIGDSTFSNCSSLTLIEIPNSVTNIGTDSVISCSSLTSINVSENNSYYSSENGVLFNKDKTELIKYPNGKTETEYIIPDSVTSIGGSTFIECTNLTSITIPNSVTEIGNSAFMGCIALEEINIPNNVKYIYSYTFRGCTNLIKIIIPNSVISIGDMAFFKCSISATILNSECEIGNYNHFDYIYGYENSTAQTYAEKNNCKFESLEEAPEKETATGDINGDGEFNIADAVILQKYLLGTGELADRKNADLCQDGVIDIFDMVQMRKLIMKK